MKVGQNIKRIRQNLGLTQSNLSQLIGLDQTNLSKYEKDKIGWTLEKLEQFAAALGVPVYQLLIDEEINDSNDTLLTEIIKSCGPLTGTIERSF